MAADRKSSPLHLEDTAPWDDTPPAADASPPPEPDPPAVEQEQVPVSRTRLPSTSRRKRSAAKVGPFDKVSCNFNLPAVLRRMLRLVAARRECDVQDIIADALVEHFERHGLEIPTTQAEYDRLVAHGKL